MKILVTGADGQLGTSIKKVSKNPSTYIFANKSHLDLSIKKNIKEVLAELDPDIIVNAAAFTDVDSAENKKLQANLINSDAVHELANFCRIKNRCLIHISTDYIFDGKKNTPYMEYDEPNPINEYGESKLRGENNIIQSNCKFIIIRTSWVYSEFGKNFLKTMHNLSKDKEYLNIIDDQIGSPTYAPDLARAILAFCDRVIEDDSLFGIYNFSGNEDISWFEFAKKIFKTSKRLGIQYVEDVRPISSKRFKTHANRPRYSVLNCDKIKKILNIEMSNIEKGIQSALEEIAFK